jgi:phage-related minor tail protein
VLDRRGVVPFARGGIVDRPVLFPFARGVGLMGEAGPEAIMPLRRTRDGRLGVEASGGGRVLAPTLVFNIATPDPDAFRKSEAQLGAAAHRMLSRAARAV